MKKIIKNWIRSGSNAMFDTVNYDNQPKRSDSDGIDCKFVSTLICVQYWNKNRNCKDISFDYKRVVNMVNSNNPSWVVDWNEEFRKLKYLPTKNGDKVKYGNLKSYRHKDKRLIRDIERKVKYGTPTFFILKGLMWTIEDLGIMKEYTNALSFSGILGHASVVIGYDYRYFYCNNPWNDKEIYRVKKDVFLSFTGEHKYYEE